MRILTALFLALAWASLSAFADEPPTEWTDPDTGHRVIRLSREPGSQSLYFHYNSYTAEGDKMVFTTPHGLATVDLRSRAVEPLVAGRASNVIVGRKTRQAFYVGDSNAVYAANTDTRRTRLITRLPPDMRVASAFGVSADEKLLAGSYIKGGREGPTQADRTTGPDGGSARSLQERWQGRQPMALFTIKVDTGTVKTFHESTDWLNHVQMSPTDPTLIMFCHEGPWHMVDRTWTIRTDGTGLNKIHSRTMDMEIAGHEFFSADGKTIWYDLQTPRSTVFWLAGYNIETGERTWYHLERNEWSVHYNVSPDGKLFAGDGGGPGSVAAPENGQWIYLFRPEKLRMTGLPGQTAKLIKVGVFKSERLVNLAKHNYSLEPNVTFTPYGKWIVFRSNMHGPTHVYAVEVEKAGDKN